MKARCLPLLLAAAAPSIAQDHDPLARTHQQGPGQDTQAGLVGPLSSGPRAAPYVNRPSTPRPAVGAIESAPDRHEPALPMGSIERMIAESMHDRVHFDVDLRGDHWARGARYKARAGADGFDFIPALGSHVERNHPVRMWLESVSRGGEPMLLEGAATVRREGHRFVLDRGPVEVRYDVALESVEQSFALDVPEGSGDLVVRIAIETDLDVRSDGSGFLITGAHGGMRYGEAFSIDGLGDASPVPATFDGTAIELRVPAGDLPAPGQPLVVDPVFTPVLVDDYTADLRRPDLAYERGRDAYLFVYEEVFSASDSEVYSVFVDATTFLPSNAQYIDVSSTSWTRPKVATVQADRMHMVVATGQDLGSSPNIVARLRSAATSVSGNQFILKGASSTYSCVVPVVGGDNYAISGQSHFCVAYNRLYPSLDRDVYALIVDTSGNWVGSEIVLEAVSFIDSGPPAISRSTGDPNRDALFCLAWTQAQNGFERVTGAQLTWDGATLSGPFDVAPPVLGADYFSVDVSCLSNVLRGPGADQVYLVSWDDAPSQVTDSFVAMCAGTTVLSTTELTRAEHADEAANQNGVVIATHPDSFTLVYDEGPTLYATVVQPVAERLGILERRIRFHTGEPIFSETAVATAFSGGGTNVDGLIATADGYSGSANILASYFYPDPNREVAGYQYCYGAPNSTGDRGFIAAFGDSSPFTVKTVGAFALPTSSFGFFLASTTTNFAPMAGGSQGTLCLGGSVGRFGVFNSGALGQGFVNVDPQAIPSPTGTTAAMFGDRWHFQAWHRDAVNGAATSNFTNAVTIVFD
ncbi:MAG: hypothetical protein AAF957_12510 [Planctomycetota bacterium]